MIEHILHAIAHAVEEHYSEENIQKRKQKEIEHKLAVKNNKPKIDAIKKDCEAAVLYAARAHDVSLNTQKNKADIDLEKMAQYLGMDILISTLGISKQSQPYLLFLRLKSLHRRHVIAFVMS